MAEFLMPKLGADMTAGTLNAWYRKPGDVVRRGDIIAEVETDKGTIDVECFSNGTVERLEVQQGETVPVGTVLALIRAEGVAPASAPAPAPTPAPSVAARPTPPVPAPARVARGRVRISPSARELARKLGVDAATIKGTGPDGAVTREDIERAAAPKPAPTPSPADRKVNISRGVRHDTTRRNGTEKRPRRESQGGRRSRERDWLRARRLP